MTYLASAQWFLGVSIELYAVKFRCVSIHIRNECVSCVGMVWMQLHLLLSLFFKNLFSFSQYLTCAQVQCDTPIKKTGFCWRIILGSSVRVTYSQSLTCTCHFFPSCRGPYAHVSIVSPGSNYTIIQKPYIHLICCACH